METNISGNVAGNGLLAAGELTLRATLYGSQWGHAGQEYRGATLQLSAGIELGGEDIAGVRFDSHSFFSMSFGELTGVIGEGSDSLSQTNQRLGQISLRLGSFFDDRLSIGMYNDSKILLGGGGDAFRTAGGEIAWSWSEENTRYTIGARLELVTGKPDHAVKFTDADNPYGVVGRYGIADMRGRPFSDLSRGQISIFGTIDSASRHSSGFNSAEITLGIESPYIRQFVQNNIVHDHVAPTPWIPVDLSKPAQPVFQLKLRGDWSRGLE